MKYRTLGQGLKVSAIGIGCMPMIRKGNISYGVADDDVSTRTIHEAIDLGITFFDTAEMYGPFRNEELVGAAIKGRREGLVIATKFAMRWDGDTPTGVRVCSTAMLMHWSLGSMPMATSRCPSWRPGSWPSAA